MSEHVYKLVEIVGTSTVGTDDAIRRAIATANQTLRHLDWFEVAETRPHRRRQGGALPGDVEGGVPAGRVSARR